MDNIYSQNIERGVLSAILFDYTIMEEIVSVLLPRHLYMPSHQIVYQAMVNLYNEDMPIDEDFIRKRIPTKEVSDSVLIEILSANAIAGVGGYIQEIIEESIKRDLITISTNVKKECLDNTISSNEIIESMKNTLDTLDEGSEIIEEFDGHDILNTQFEKVPLYMTGIKAIDDEMEGIENGQLIYVTGLEETGKTHITYKIMENISFSRKVGIISLEFGKEKFKNRLSNMIRNNHQITPRNIKASFNCHNITRLEKTIKKWYKDGAKFIVIDSINLIENHLIKDRFERVLNIGTRLFKLTQQLEITIFVISTSTKDDNKNGNPSIYGGQLLNNYCDQKWHIFRDFETEDRVLWVNKNKQNYKYPKIDLRFDKDGTIRGKHIDNNTYSKQPVVTEYQPDTSVDMSDIF